MGSDTCLHMREHECRRERLQNKKRQQREKTFNKHFSKRPSEVRTFLGLQATVRKQRETECVREPEKGGGG